MALAMASAGMAWGHGDDGEAAAPSTATKHDHDRFILGETGRIGGRRVATWAVVTSAGKIEEVGVTIPLSVFTNQPGPLHGFVLAI